LTDFNIATRFKPENHYGGGLVRLSSMAPEILAKKRWLSSSTIY
jgi:hypothetical protein